MQLGCRNRLESYDVGVKRGNTNCVLQSAAGKRHVFNLESLSGPNPNPLDIGICRKLQNKLEADLLNIVQLKLTQRGEESEAW